jgi:hypothetical protein
VLLQLRDLVGVVAEQLEPVHAEGAEHLHGDRVVPLVCAVAEGLVRLVGVEPGVLQDVRVELGVQPDAAALLAQVQQVAARSVDQPDGLRQLRPAVAALAAEQVAREALAVQPYEGRPPCRRSDGRTGGVAAETQRDVLAAVHEPVEGDQPRGRREAIGEPHGEPHLGADRRGGQLGRVGGRRSGPGQGSHAGSLRSERA